MERGHKPKVRNLDPEYLNRLDLLDTTEAAAYLRTSTSTLAKKRMNAEDGPRFIRQSARKVIYRRADLDAWLNRQAGATFEKGAA